jgi:hypothetical protein
MAMVISREPAIFIPEKELVVYHRPHETRLEVLDDIARKAGDFARPVKAVLFNLLSELSERSISFRSIEVTVEQDVEIPSWKYALLRVELETTPKELKGAEDELIERAYFKLDKRDSTKVLLVLTHV